jgi:hypothetical protein
MADVPSSKDEDEENGFVNSIVSYIVGIIIAAITPKQLMRIVKITMSMLSLLSSLISNLI